MEIDVGERLAGLLEKFAQQIGTTADKVFPWFVKQQYMEGCMYLAAHAAAVVLLFSAALWGFITMLKEEKKRKLNPGEDTGDREIAGNIAFCFCGFLFVCVLGAFCYYVPSYLTKILNPEYHAVKAILSGLGR